MSTFAHRHLVVRSGLALLLAMTLGSGCRSADEPTPSTSASEVEVDGVITQVFPLDPAREPRRLVLQTSSGPVVVRLKAGHPYGFDLQHLREHARTRDPVAIVAENDSGILSAVSIADA